ncbi:aspartate--tRNA ligase [bacterium]|nr:aspartate--tRNA ligase [bacterium]
MRTNYNGEITKANVNQNVTLFGWVNRIRKLGGLIFIDLRDTSGIVQVVVRPEKDFFSFVESITNESVIEVEGKVILRESPNLKIPTGEIEVDATNVKLLSKSDPLPIDKNSNDEIRLKYRYLDLRREEFQHIFKTKSKVLSIVREYLNNNRFVECETPVLCKSTPEGARDYLVPSRIFKGEFYALPQSPQILKQLLMVAGMDRYYQIAKCFRDEDLRADRQPEFTQIDIETSFLTQDELLSLLEGMYRKIFKEILNVDLPNPFPKMKYDDAIRDYGSDKPDTRFELKLNHLENLFSNVDSPLFNNKFITGIKVKDENQYYTRKKIDELTEYIKKHGGQNLLFIKKTNNEYSGSIIKLLNEEILNNLSLDNNEIYFLTSHDTYLKSSEAMGSLRLKVARDLDLIDKNLYDFKWIIEFPLFELADDGSISSTHHPFTRPLKEHEKFLKTDPLKVYSYAYDMVAFGYELGGGSLRIYDNEIQKQIFEILNISSDQQKSKFGYLLDAMNYGFPPHGGAAFGLERLMMVLTNTENIRDVILFPKTTTAQDLMLDCPSEVDDSQLSELGIMVRK